MCFLHPRYYPKIKGDIMKTEKKNKWICFKWRYMINDNENEAGDQK